VYFEAPSGLSSFSVGRARDTTSFTGMDTPTVTELGSTGVYALLLDEDMTIDADHVTEQMVFQFTAAGMTPTTIEVELFSTAVLDALNGGIIYGVAETGTLSTTGLITFSGGLPGGNAPADQDPFKIV